MNGPGRTGLGLPAGSGDQGEATPQLCAALELWGTQGSPAARAEVLAALPGSRLFVGVTSVALGTEPASRTGLRAESGAELAVVGLVSAAGERALVACSSVAELARWRPELRPVAVPAEQACAAAVQDGASALVLDPAGPHLALRRVEVAELAQGRVPVAGAALSLHATGDAFGALAAPPDPELVGALGRALRGEQVVSARLLAGPAGPVLGVVPAVPLTAAELAGLAARVAGRIAGRLPPDGLDLAVVGPSGPGHPVPVRRGLLGRR